MPRIISTYSHSILYQLVVIYYVTYKTILNNTIYYAYYNDYVLHTCQIYQRLHVRPSRAASCAPLFSGLMTLFDSHRQSWHSLHTRLLDFAWLAASPRRLSEYPAPALLLSQSPSLPGALLDRHPQPRPGCTGNLQSPLFTHLSSGTDDARFSYELLVPHFLQAFAGMLD